MLRRNCFPFVILTVACGGSVPQPAPTAAPAPEASFKLHAASPTVGKPAPSVAARPRLVTPPAPALPSVGPPVTNPLVPSVIAGNCAISPGGELHCAEGERDLQVPPGKFFSIERSKSIYCGVRVDQSALCWRFRTQGFAPVLLPPGKFAALVPEADADENRGNFCGIRPEGDAECWTLISPPHEATTVRPVQRLAGKFVQARVSSFEFGLLAADGRLTTISGSFHAVSVKPGGGNFTEIGASHRVRSDGAYVEDYLGSERVKTGAFVSGDRDCVLARDGSVTCGKEFFPGPFVQIKEGCGVRLDGRLKGLKGGCPARGPAQVPDLLRSRIQVPSESLAVAHFNQLEKLRTVEGTAREYRVGFSERSEEHYLLAEKRGAITSAVPHDSRGNNLLEEESDFVLVDINGGEIQLGDPAYIKRAGRYLAPGADPEHRLELVAEASPRARWTIHTFDRNADPKEPYEPVRRGLANVLLRASATGEFLLPCPAFECANPPEHSGVRPAGARSDIGPWWVKDPYWSDIDAEPNGQHLKAGWKVAELVDCDATDPWTNKRRHFRCESMSRE